MPVKGFVQLRRGILEHLSILTGSETKLYIALLCLASPSTGKITTTATDLADITCYSPQTILVDLKRLNSLGYIAYKPAQNQYSPAVVSIKKWSQSVPIKTIGPTRDQPVTNHRSKVGARSSELQKGDPDSQIARKPDKKEIPHGFDSVWKLWRKKDGSETAQTRYRTQIKGAILQDEFLRAAKNYTNANSETDLDYYMKLVNFIGTINSGRPWRDWVVNNPNAKHYCKLDDGTVIWTRKEADKLLDDGKATCQGGHWRRL